MHVTLMVVNGVHKGLHIPVPASEFLIGRSKRCQLRPIREDVSRKHCALLQRDGRLFLRDEASSNGTILNRRTLVQGEMPITDGDEFDIGPLRFRVLVTEHPLPASPATEEDDSCFDSIEIYNGLPGEQEPSNEATIEITRPMLPRPQPRRPLTDEVEKLS